MTFEAYMNNIRTKTGKVPKDFFDEAVKNGILRPDTKTMSSSLGSRTARG
jgi:hypothetical protein